MLALDPERLADASADLELDFVVLLGSYLNGTQRTDSDLDLAVMPSRQTPTALEVVRTLSERLGRSDLDLIWLPGASWLLESEVSRGRLMVERQVGGFTSFCRYSRMRQADSQPWRRRKQAYIDRFLSGAPALDSSLVEDKIARMVQYLTELERVFAQGAERFCQDALVHYAGERLLELLVEGAVAVNTEVAQVVAAIPPSDYYSSFFSMQRTGWIDQETARELAACASLRNRVVHQYEKVQLDELYQVLHDSAPHWREYIRQVREKLDSV